MKSIKTPRHSSSDECARIREHMSFIEALVANMVAEKEKKKDAEAEKLEEEPAERPH
ncbi:hypothetical protein [Xylella fastidiosa]|uniref:hypothetical protein n=1 Tax=Xylella fastidiosa TaxID=2371 RepID=UPI0039856023